MKRICQVISRRLTVLYTWYCPMSVFICVSLLVSFCSRLFHPQISKMVLFVTMLLPALYYVYRAMVSHAVSLYKLLAYCVGLMLSPFCYRQFHFGPGGSR